MPSYPQALSIEESLEVFDDPIHGLSSSEVALRLSLFGRNALPRPAPPGIPLIFLRQLLSPATYVLLLVAVISFFLEEASEGVFISIVLLIDASL
jgi:Ca2+-transporting ATPase